MYFKIKSLVKADSSLEATLIQSGLEKEYLSVTACQRAWKNEFNTLFIDHLIAIISENR